MLKSGINISTKDLAHQTQQIETDHSKSFKFLFYACFILLFVIGGSISFTGIIPFRMAYVAFLPMVMMPFFRPKFDSVFIITIIFTIHIFLSAFLNGLSLTYVITFFRFVLIPYSMYYVVKKYCTPKTIKKIINICMALGMIQLPIIIFQKSFYDTLIQYSAVHVIQIDFDFGTFYTANDPATVYFILGLILFMLFDKNGSEFIKNKGVKIIWLATTVLITNSKLLSFVMLSVFGVYFLMNIKLKQIAISLLIISSVASVIVSLGFADNLKENIELAVSDLTLSGGDSRAEIKAFLEGKYSRQAAVLYYLSQPIKFIGDGPSRYFDPITGEYSLGNRGQIFIFYSEIGLIGLFLGFLILFFMQRSYSDTSLKFRMGLFIIISLLTLTTSVMSDASLIFMYNIFLSASFLSQSPQKKYHESFNNL